MKKVSKKVNKVSATADDSKNYTADKIANLILEQLDKGVCPWRKTWKGGLVPQSVDGRPYRGINALILGTLPYETPRYLTFAKAKEMGGSVKKGEHGYPVILWKPAKSVEKDKDGNPVLDKDGNPKMHRFFTMRGYTVFNVAQCDGLPESCYKVEERKEHEPIKEAEELWGKYDDKPTTRFTNGNSAFYSPARDEINVPNMNLFDSPEEFYATLFHEGVHSTGHKSRLHRFDGGDGFGSEKYSKEELVAEIGATLLCNMCGITMTLENAAAYCKSWAEHIRGERSVEIVYAAARAQKAADWIMGKKFKEEA